MQIQTHRIFLTDTDMGRTAGRPCIDDVVFIGSDVSGLTPGSFTRLVRGWSSARMVLMKALELLLLRLCRLLVPILGKDWLDAMPMTRLGHGRVCLS